MTVLTAQETALLRSRPHNTKLYLSIFQPKEVFSGRITGSVSKGMRDLTFYSFSGTTFQAGITGLVGTTPSGYDKGKIRVKELDVNLGTAVVAENSNINWQVGDYFTVIGFFEIWPIYPRIIQDPSNEMRTLWYKDYDVPYTNQNSQLGYFINMGSNYAGFIENGECKVYYDAEGTEHVRADETGTSYYWTFGGEPGGRSPTTYYGKTPGYVTYTLPGHFLTRLIVSGSVTQSSDYSNRCVSILSRPGSGSVSPILSWELTNLAGSRDQGGYTASIRIRELIPETSLRDGSLIVIFADDKYGTTDQHIGGNSIGRENVVFSGYVVDGTIKYNYKDSYVDFDIASPTEIMKMAEGFSVSVQDSDDPAGDAASNPDIPSGWVALLDMDVKKALYHYLKWHSTVLNVCDFQHIGTNQPIQYFDADRTSIYDAVNTLISSAVVGGIVCDRQGKIWAETDIYVTTGTYNTGLSINKQDWMGEPVIEDRPIGQVSYIEIGGIAYNGITFEALMAAAPGVTPAYRGKIQRIQGLALTDQTQLNILAGNLYAQLNARYPNVEMQIAGNYRNFDIAPQEIVPLTINPSDTIRGITFNQKSFYINSIRWDYSPKTEMMYPTLGLEEIASGFAADTMEIPDVPPVEGDAGGFTIPPIVFPPINLPPWPTFPSIGDNILVNPQYAFNSTTAAEALRYNTTPAKYFYICPDGNTVDTNGAFVFPLGSTVATVYAVFCVYTNAASGNAYVEIINSVYTNLGVVVSQSDDFLGTVLVPQQSNALIFAGPATIPGAPGYVVTWDAVRYGGDVLDTYASNLLFVGLLVIFS